MHQPSPQLPANRLIGLGILLLLLLVVISRFYMASAWFPVIAMLLSMSSAGCFLLGLTVYLRTRPHLRNLTIRLLSLTLGGVLLAVTKLMLIDSYPRKTAIILSQFGSITVLLMSGFFLFMFALGADIWAKKSLGINPLNLYRYSIKGYFLVGLFTTILVLIYSHYHPTPQSQNPITIWQIINQSLIFTVFGSTLYGLYEGWHRQRK